MEFTMLEVSKRRKGKKHKKKENRKQQEDFSSPLKTNSVLCIIYYVLCFPPRKQETSVQEGALELFFPHPPEL